MVDKRLKSMFVSFIGATVLALMPGLQIAHASVLESGTGNGAPAAAPQSDDFDDCILNSDLWTFSDPLANSVFSNDGSVVTIEMAAGEEHDLWEGKNQAPRLMQAITNENFSVEVKFESAVSQQFQTQGIIIEQDSNNLLRFDFYHDGSNVLLFSAGFVDGTPTTYTNKTLTDVPASPSGFYLRVARDGDTWFQSYSFTGNGTDWSSVAPVQHTLTTTQVGLFGGNVTPGNNQEAPAHTVIADYFFNSASPISPEDDTSIETLQVSIDGEGTVSPDPGDYSCGEQQLTATPGEGWQFAGWSGDVEGPMNPTTLLMNGARAITATFAPIPEGNSSIFLPLTLQ